MLDFANNRFYILGPIYMRMRAHEGSGRARIIFRGVTK